MADTVSQRGESRKAIPKLSHPVDLSKAVDEKLLVERVFVVRADELEENAERIIPVVFSTEFEYVQWFGREMLSHDSDAVDLTRMMNKTAPVLLNHSRDGQIGVVEDSRIANRQGLANLRFSKGVTGEEIYRDVIDGIRSQISCGYRILKWEIDETDPSNPLYTITQWQPFEISVVTLNADPNSLVKRSGYFTPDDIDEPEQTDRTPAGESAHNDRGKTMSDKTAEQVTLEATRANGEVNVASFEIYERGKAENEQTLAMDIIGKRGSLHDFEKALRDKREQLSQEAKQADSEAERDANLKNRFSLSDLIFQQLNPGASRGKRALEEAQDLTSDLQEQGYTRQSNGLLIPHSRLGGIDKKELAEAKRDLTSAAASGGNLISDDVRGDIFIEALRNRMVLGDMVTMLTGLQGNVSIPAETTAPTGAWRTENQANTESNPVIGQVALTPHFVRAFTEVSRTLIAQSSVDVEMIVRNLLMKSVALVVDKAILTGTGTNGQPSGIDSISGLSETTYATAITNATLANIVAVEKALDDGHAPDMGRFWVVAPDVRAHYRVTPIGTGGIPAWYMGNLLDSPGYVSKQVADGEAYFAAFAECFLALWDSIEILVNPFSGDTTGLVRITAWQNVDVGFAHGASFAKLKQA